MLERRQAKSLHKAPPIGNGSKPIGLKIELVRGLMVIDPHIEFEKVRTKTEGARAQTSQKFAQSAPYWP